MEITDNQQILDRLDDLEVEIRIIREKIENEKELTDWAKNELREARALPSSEFVSHEKVKEILLRK